MGRAAARRRTIADRNRCLGARVRLDRKRSVAAVADPPRRLPANGGGVMTGFLDRLVGMALGDVASSAAYPSLPPRFAPVPGVTSPVQEDDRTAVSESPPLEALAH